MFLSLAVAAVRENLLAGGLVDDIVMNDTHSFYLLYLSFLCALIIAHLTAFVNRFWEK